MLFLKKRGKGKNSIMLKHLILPKNNWKIEGYISKGESATITCSGKALIEQISIGNKTYRSSDTDGTVSSLIESSHFPKRRNSSGKRKRCSVDRLYKNIAKLGKEKLQLKRKCDSLKKKIVRNPLASSSLTPKRRTLKMTRAVGDRIIMLLKS